MRFFVFCFFIICRNALVFWPCTWCFSFIFFFYKSTLLFAVFRILCVIFSEFQALISLTLNPPPCLFRFIFLFNCFGHWFKHRLSCPQESYLLLSITLSILCIMLISCASVKLCRQATNLFILLNYVVFFSFCDSSFYYWSKRAVYVLSYIYL